jgi:hypothetical protein
MASDRQIADSGLTVFCQAALLLALGGASVGLAVGTSIAWRELTDFALRNELERSLRYLMLGCVAAGALAAPLVGILWARRRRTADAWARLYAVARRLSPLYGVGCLPLLFHRRIWVGRELDFLVLVGLFSLGEWAAVRTAQGSPPLAWERKLATSLDPAQNGLWAVLPSFVRRYWAAASLVVLAAGVAARSVYAVAPPAASWVAERSFLSHLWRGGLPYSYRAPSGGAEPHANFLAYAVAAVHALFPGPETLLLVHTVLIVGAALPLFLLARRQLGQGIALLVSLVYLAYPALHGAGGRDLAYLPLGVGFFWLAWDAMMTRRDGRAAWAMLLGVAAGEEVAAWLVVLGLYLLLSRIRPRAGLLVAGLGGLYFVGTAYFVLPRYGGVSYTAGYHGLLGSTRTGLDGALATAVANPGYAISRVGDSFKLVDGLKLLMPLALLPLKSPLAGLLLLPGLAFTVLTTERGTLGDLANPQNVHWAALLFVGVVLALNRYRRAASPGLRPHVAALVALLCAAIPSSHQLGAVLRQPVTPVSFKLEGGDDAAEASGHASEARTSRAAPGRHP